VSHDRAFLNGVVTSTLAIEPDGQVKEYDGGYDDYLRQKPAEVPAESKARSSTAPPKPTPQADKPRKLSGKEKRELEELPKRIHALEETQGQLHAEMADPSFYRKDGGEIAEAKQKLEALEQELALAYERWEELEALA